MLKLKQMKSSGWMGVSVATLWAAFGYLNYANAATMSLIPAAPTAAVGDNWNVNVRIDSTGQSINATQGTLTYPKNLLDVVGVYRQNSIFNIWSQDPAVSTSTGEVNFLAGSTNAFSGPSLYVMTVSFRVRASGTATVGFKDAGVTSGDGTGSNVLSDAFPLTASFGKGSAVSSAGTGATTTASTSSQDIAAPAIQPPTQIKREASQAVKLPAKPVVTVPLYPVPGKWYAESEPFFANWDLPSDITQVAAVLNVNPDFTPTATEGLFDDKQFPGLADGVSYLHVRFKNDMGWGPTAHYRIGVDTAPPVAFKIDIQEGTSTANPQPTLLFHSADSLSGISYYAISVDAGSAASTTATEYVLPLEEPGSHVAKVVAADGAGNLTSGNVAFTILPIDSPVIDPVKNVPFVGEGGLTVTGTSLPDAIITVNLEDANNSKNSMTTSAVADSSGRWTTQFTEPMAKGRYFIAAIATNSAKAHSLPVKTPVFNVRERPIFTLGGIAVTLGSFTILLAILLVAVFAGGVFLGRWLLGRMRVRAVITERDLMAAMNRVERSVKAGLAGLDAKQVTDHELSEIRNAFQGIRKAMSGVQQYISKEIEEIAD